LKIANCAWDLYTLYPEICHTVDCMVQLVQGAGFFSSPTLAEGWACGIAAMTLHAGFVADIASEESDAEGVKAFLSNHLAMDHGGEPFSEQKHIRWSYGYETDAVIDLFAADLGTFEEVTESFGQLFNTWPETAIPAERLDLYLESRLAQVKEASRWSSMDSQAVLLLPELREDPSWIPSNSIPLLLRPTYLDYFKTIARLNSKLYASKVAPVGLKVDSHGPASSGAVTGLAGVLLGIGSDFGAGAHETHIQGLEMDARAHLFELWGRGGAFRVADLQALPEYLYGMKAFLEQEFAAPHYLGAGTFASTIESLEVGFPESSPGILDTTRLTARVTVRNEGDPARTVLVARSYASDWLGNLLGDVYAYLQPVVFFRDWRDTKVNSLVDMALVDSGRRLSAGTEPEDKELSADFELLTGADFLASTLDLQEAQVSVFTGPWETSSRRAFYNAWKAWIEQGEQGVPAGRLLAYRGGAAQADELDAWLERVDMNEEFTLTPGAPTAAYDYAVPDGIASLRLSLRKLGGAKMHLLATDSRTGRRAGFLGDEGREVCELSGSYSGPLGAEETIVVSVAPADSTQDESILRSGSTLAIAVVLDAPGTEPEAKGLLALLVQPVRPAILGVQPESVEICSSPGKVIDFTLEVAEVGRQFPFTNLSVEVSALSGSCGDSILPRDGRSTHTPNLEAGKTISIHVEFDMTTAVLGQCVWSGTISITADGIVAQSVPVTICIDDVAPETSLVDVPPALTSERILISWRGTDAFPPDGQLFFETFIQGLDGEWSGPQTGTQVGFDDLGPGDYTFQVRAVDLAGNVDSSPAAASFKVVTFQRGYANNDDLYNMTDAISILNWLFLGTAKPRCVKAADVNDDGKVDITDGVRLLNHLFLGGPAPPPPFAECGLDPTEDDLDCQEFPLCAAARP
jgi:hypothetical protein